MVRTTTWWRNLGGLLAACVLSLLVVAPAVASAACVCDERPLAAAGQTTVETSPRHDTAPCKAACCLGGHCHHANSWVEEPAATMAAPTLGGAKLVIAAPRPLASIPPSPLDDPPRA